MLLFKIVGFSLVMLTCSAFGFLKAYELKQRHKRLCAFQKGIVQLKEHIRLQYGERDRILQQCFAFNTNDFSHLQKEDSQILADFFDSMGMADSEAESRRCEMCISLLNPKISEAEESYARLGKLYRSMGVMSGLFICIFLI